jgi:hypothetical protein
VPPSTTQALLITIVVALPGVVYYATRDQLLVSFHTERDVASKVLRAITVSVALDSLYVLVLGRALTDLAQSLDVDGRLGFGPQPRLVAAVGLTLFIVVPALVAVAEAVFVRRRARAQYDATPTAWDRLFRDRGGCFVRVKMHDGSWVGGWYGTGSFASAYPHDHDLYLVAQYAMDPDGSFGPRVPGTGGVYIPASTISVLEVVNTP